LCTSEDISNRCFADHLMLVKRFAVMLLSEGYGQAALTMSIDRVSAEAG